MKRSRREWLVTIAKRLKVTFPPGISDNALQNLIDKQPATQWQVTFLQKYLRTKGLPFPKDLTFGKARTIIAAINDLENTDAIEALGIEEGQVWDWQGKYYLIERVYGDQKAHKLLVQQVLLSRGGGEKASMKQVGEKIQLNPYKLLDGGGPVDLTIWSPDN